MKFKIQNLQFLYIFTFMCNLLVGMIGLGLPLFAIHLGAGNISLGALGTLGSLVYLLFVPFSGWLSDRMPKHLQAGAGIMLSGATLCAIPFVTQLFWIFPLYFIYMMGLGLLWPTLESALGKFVAGRALARSSGWYNVSWSSGACIGYLIAGVIYGRNSGAVFWIAGGFAVAFGLMFAMLFSAPKEGPKMEATEQANSVRLLYLSWIANGMTYFIMNIMRNIFPKLGESLGFSSTDLGLLLLCLPAAQCAIFILFNLTAVWHFKFWPLVLSMVFLFTGLCIVVATEKMGWFAGGFLLIGVGGGISYSASLYYAVALEASIAGARSGWHEFYVGLGGFTGPVIGGLLAHYIGPKSPYAFSGALVVIMLSVQVFYYRWKAI